MKTELKHKKMSNLDLIIETNNKQIISSIEDDKIITIFHRTSIESDFSSVKMSKYIFSNMIKNFIENQTKEIARGTFTNPTID